MKLLIVYSTKNGTVRTCVQRLEQALIGLEITTVCLEKEDCPTLEDYDVILAGGSVYFGKLRPVMRRFLRENEDTLCKKRLGLFFCCGLAHEMEYYVEKVFSQKLREAAFQTLYFGGMLKIESCSLLDRLLLHSMRSSIFESEIEDGEYTPTLPSILPENIEKMATYTRAALQNRN